MPDKLTFDGVSKSILLRPGVSTLDAGGDLYSEWKRWAQQDANLGYPGAFRTFGGDQTIAGQFAPKYFFLTNGWRIIVDDGVDLIVGVNLYTDELVSPFIVTGDATVSLTNSDAVVVDDGVAETMDYGGVVILNAALGVDSTTYPAGTVALPVNNLADAKTIAELHNITKIHIFGHAHFDVDLEGYVVEGGNINDVVHFHNDVSVDKTTFRQCVLTGHYVGEIYADNCIIEDDLRGMSGYFQYCGFRGGMHFDSGVTTVLNDCHSQVAGQSSPSLHLNTGVSLSLRKYSGGMAVYDCGAGTVCTLEFLVGNCRLLTGNTGGTMVVRGIATLTDQSAGMAVITEGMIIPTQLPTIADLTVVNEGVKKASLMIPHSTSL
jgi:hypothetical protein